jgi:hypothetical protein
MSRKLSEKREGIIPSTGEIQLIAMVREIANYRDFCNPLKTPVYRYLASFSWTPEKKVIEDQR